MLSINSKYLEGEGRSLFALVDCNNFYVSCERVFNPKLSGAPVIVLSNNDGCAIARSNEAKALGIKMGEPFFKIRHIKKGINVFSSNYALYGDMSRRVMQTLEIFSDNLEPYSIDEAFMDISSFTGGDITSYARLIKDTVKKYTGIPVSVGVGTSKTLCKIAGHIAKNSTRAAGVLDLTPREFHERALAMIPVGDIWGVGRRSASFLISAGIDTALKLRDASEHLIRSRMGINGIRTMYELRGVSCYPLEIEPQRRKRVSASRTFSRPLTDLHDIRAAVARRVTRGAEKLRNENLAAGVIAVYLNTSRFDEKNYSFNSQAVRLVSSTSDTLELTEAALRGLELIFTPGRRYKKAGIILGELIPEKKIQMSLFDNRDRARSERLMRSIDMVNRKIGSSAVKLAVTGTESSRRCETVSAYRSPSYTTRWTHLPSVS